MTNRRLVIQTVGALTVCAVLVAFCYVAIDRSVALWADNHPWLSPAWISNSPDVIIGMEVVAPVLLVLAAIRRLWGPWRRWEAMVAVLALNVLAMFILKQGLKWIFGRPCPKFWLAYEHSVIENAAAYQFHWFQGGRSPYDSFPSGHATIACGLVALMWVFWPKWRWPAGIVLLALLVCLVTTNYHYVGDVIAGSCLGWLGGCWTARFLPNWMKPEANGSTIHD
ncbi:MAG TPA: phosphatase PAP2 family protein [Pirellulales bacterium]|nr:phosphatase PAP2 family protein [Pirellulales bacterium]